MDELTVMMLGSMGVGKTSTLATIYQEIVSLHDETGFDIQASDDDTLEYLQDAITQMKSVDRQPNFKEIVKVLAGNAAIFKNNFTIKLHKKPYLKLSFFDIPGGFMKIKRDHPEYSSFIQIRDNADIFLNVIDGAALVAGSDSYFQEKATPLLIQNIIKETKSRSKKALFLFVITKCERWLKIEKDRKLLQERFLERYAPVLDTLKNATNIAAVMIPVKTMGCVEYNTWDREENKPLFMKMDVNAKFKPEDTDQPLRYIITFALVSHYENWPWYNKLRYHLTGEQGRYKEAFSEFARYRHPDFLTFGEQRLLGLNHNRLK